MDRELIDEQEREQKLGWKAGLDYDDEDKPDLTVPKHDNSSRTIFFVKDVNGLLFGSKLVDGKFPLVKSAAHPNCLSILDKDLLMLDSGFTDESFKDPDYACLDKNCIRCGKPL
jgi:hypothetical protein